MMAALDSNVLLDILIPNETFFERSLAAIGEAASRGRLVVCEMVYAELTCHFPDRNECDRFLAENDILVEGASRDTCFEAGRAWRAHLRSGGKRDRILPDFLIGAHAWKQANCLITRDRGFYGSYFPELRLIDPAAARRSRR